MKTKRKPQKLLSLLLCCIMLVGMMPMTAGTVFATNPAIGNVLIDGGKCFYIGQQYYKNGDESYSFTGSESDYNAHYDPATGVLMLKDYTGGGITIGGAIQANITIELIGTNTVTGSIENNVSGGGDITITGSGSLTVNNTGSDMLGVRGIAAGYGGTSTNGNITIAGNANVTINTTNNNDDAGKAYGIYAKQSITISGNASVNITCSTPNSTLSSDTCYGMFVPTATSGGKVTINTGGTIKINVKDAGTNADSYGIYAPNYDLTTVNHMIAEWKGTARGAFYGIAPTFDSANYAVNIDTTNCYASYRYGTPYTVNVTNGDLTGPGVKYSNWQDAYYFLAGDNITLTAPTRYADSSNTIEIPFVKWVSENVTITSSESQTDATFIMPSKNVKVTAKYNPFTEQPKFTRDSQYKSKGAVSVGLISDSYSDIPKIRATSDLTGASFGDYTSGSKTFTVYENYCPAGEYVVAVTYNGTTYYSEPFMVNYVAPTATVSNVTVRGNKGASIENTEVEITLNNDGFKDISNGTDVSSWFNLPAGLTAKVKYIEQDIETGRKQGVTITISGTPTVTSNTVMAITIPADYLVTSTSNLTVTTNNDAKYNIDVLKYEFSITPGEGITLGDNSTQTVEAGNSITSVICTAKEGYYFPTDYSSITTNSSGISITRNSYTQITVSGTPTTDVGVLLAAATAKEKETTPAADFAANGESSGTLSNVENGMKYSLDGGSTWIDITGDTVTIESGVTAGKDIKVMKPATDTDTGLDSDVQTIDITKAAKPADVTAVDCTTASNDDGKLTNVTTAMEYRKMDESSSSGWTTCTGTEVTGLSNGTYHVRIKASGTELASEDEIVVIAAYNAVKYSVTVTVNDSSYGTASASKNANVAEGETVTLMATPSTGYVFDKWEAPSTVTINDDGTFTMPNADVSVKACFKPAALTGTVTITGTEKFGQTLTAAVSGSNNTGTLTYNWYRDGAEIATGNSYTIAAEDIGKALTCKVTSNVQTGTIEKNTANIAKADGPAAPTGLNGVACTTSANNDGKITGVTTAMEYSNSAEFTSKTTCTGTEIAGLTNGTYYIRIAETATHKAGAYIAVTVAAYTAPIHAELGGTVSIEGTAKYNEILTANTSGITGNTGTLSYQWKRDGSDISGATDSTYTLVQADIGKNITVSVTSSVETGTITSSGVTIEKADGPAAPTGLNGVACTTSANNDGKITGTTDKMEYSNSAEFTGKTTCTGTEITGLTNGTYYIRIAETATHKAGAYIAVTVAAYTAPPAPPSGGGGGGLIPAVQEPDITIIGSGKATLSTDGSTADITADEGYELVSITVNGKEIANTDKLTGLKTGDKVVVTFQKKSEEPTVDTKAIADKVGKMKLTARSSKTAKKNIKITVNTDKETNNLIKEIKDLGYTVKYKYYRSTKKASKYTAKVEKDADINSYINTSGKKGTKYYYKVRVMVYDADGSLVAKSDLKQCKYAARTWSK